MKSLDHIQLDEEARALAACYRLLLQKAAERQGRLEQADHKKPYVLETAVPGDQEAMKPDLPQSTNTTNQGEDYSPV